MGSGELVGLSSWVNLGVSLGESGVLVLVFLDLNGCRSCRGFRCFEGGLVLLVRSGIK